MYICINNVFRCLCKENDTVHIIVLKRIISINHVFQIYSFISRNTESNYLYYCITKNNDFNDEYDCLYYCILKKMSFMICKHLHMFKKNMAPSVPHVQHSMCP